MRPTKEKMQHARTSIYIMKNREPSIKPNFSAIGRELGLSRQTVARIWKGTDKQVKPRRKKASKFDPYADEIREKFESQPYSIKAVFQFFQGKYGTDVFSSYDSFKSYVRTNKIREKRTEKLKARPRYETKEGEEVQLDWKESLKMTLKTGEVIEFNVFAAVYGFSRYVQFVYSKTKTTEDFIRCLIEIMNEIGGKPSRFKTDNMSAVVQVKNGRKTKLPIIRQLEKDMGVPIELCKAHNPQSKGKVESVMRILEWLQPYQGELKSEEELIEVIKLINRQINNEPSRTTGHIRSVLMDIEKEYLKPLNSQLVLESYLQDVETQVVAPTCLVTYKGKGYSVPKEFIGQRVKLAPKDDKLRIYYNGKLVCCHQLSDNAINYLEEHYTELLKVSIPQRGDDSANYQEMIEEKARSSLQQMGKLKGKAK